jgi:hypothetical protein
MFETLFKDFKHYSKIVNILIDFKRYTCAFVKGDIIEMNFQPKIWIKKGFKNGIKKGFKPK